MVNKVQLIGYLGKDPEVRFSPQGKALAKFSVATSEKWRDAQGVQQERTEWHNIVVWGKQAEACGQYLNKGRLVYIEGSIRTRSYDDRDGNKKYITEINARDVRFLGGKSGGGGSGAAPAPPGEDYEHQGAGGEPPPDDDIPSISQAADADHPLGLPHAARWAKL